MSESPVFILTCMRSYSSLVCGMLGQHPQLYGLPEVNLFVTDGVGELLDRARKARPSGLHGLLRTIAQIEHGTQTEDTVEQARAWLDQRRGWTTAELFHHIVEAVSPRVCVEKSPSNVLRMEHLERLLRCFPDARILHLTRHPRPTCRSIYEVMSANDRRLGLKRADNTDIEALWLNTHRHVMTLAQRLDLGQYIRLQGEALLGDLDRYLPQLAEWLGIGAAPEDLEAVRHPERSPFACPGPSNAKLGNDPNFLNNPFFTPREIPQARLDGPLEWLPAGTPSGFSDATRTLARRFGYR